LRLKDAASLDTGNSHNLGSWRSIVSSNRFNRQVHEAADSSKSIFSNSNRLSCYSAALFVLADQKNYQQQRLGNRQRERA